ncbi:endonuclease, putative [Plasmodium chabaudi chabaudi]|uniref:Endonuclease, putative n=1 Tax=Plasmodium chabaudi chabaudi TaxID=31271 RepID=A0A077TMJ3_PLACU|nr:endonuclease, putative [Plasmodium chabaudi chabaudi]SCN61790.1 endonuclease, putative [Plasmodium chabaudi chabaudi]VTZ69542.1 endonuclease, putative [Plasmodium chabaudi chabaudi]|eukprot:XP_744918.2 endonuclease, putative [Plasmodium chabaudi chabaudi]
MTIKGFISFIHKKIPSTIKKIDDIKSFEGKKFIIDGTFFIYKFMYVAWKHILNDKNRDSKYKANELGTYILIRQYIIKKSIELLKNQHEYFKSLKINTLYIIEDIGARCELQPIDFKCKRHVWKERDTIRKKKKLFDILNADAHKNILNSSDGLSDTSSSSIGSILNGSSKKITNIITPFCDKKVSPNKICERKIGKKEKVEIIVDEDGTHDLFKKNIFIKINSQTANDIYNYLLLEKIPIFITKNDAEKECAIQCSHEKDIVVSDDTDALAFGAPNLIRFITNKKKRHIINKDEILSELDINYEQFIDFCILSGCDYSAKIPGIGPIKAYEIIKKYKTIESFLESSAFDKYSNTKRFNQKLSDVSMTLKDYILNEFTYEQARKIFFNSY